MPKEIKYFSTSMTKIMSFLFFLCSGGGYIDFDSQCMKLNELWSLALRDDSNILLSEEGGELEYTIPNGRRKLVQWAFFSRPKNLMMRSVIEILYDNFFFLTRTVNF